MNFSESHVAAEIVKIISKTENSGVNCYDLCNDFIALCEAYLRMLPAHALHMQQHGVPLPPEQDPEDVQQLFARLRGRYTRAEHWQRFIGAFDYMVTAADEAAKAGEYIDYLGEVYMNYGYPNPHAGQYFTPRPVCKMMASTIMGENDVHAMLLQAFDDARAKMPAAERILLESVVLLSSLDPTRSMQKALAMQHAYLKPISICDPAVGSGRLLLAAAEQIPRWQIDFGLVQFYGQDIDLDCVNMAKVNCMLYGLNRKPITHSQWLQAEALAKQLTEQERKRRDTTKRMLLMKGVMQKSLDTKFQNQKTTGGNKNGNGNQTKPKTKAKQTEFALD